MQTDLANQTTYPNRGSRFADADGDGIADSRWTWAPLPSDAGLAYVMAVRIIDNSAMVDLNAWTNPIPLVQQRRWMTRPAGCGRASWTWSRLSIRSAPVRGPAASTPPP